MILYYLHEPFDAYKCDGITSGQYVIRGRGDSEKALWIDDIRQTAEDKIEIITEDGCSLIISV